MSHETADDALKSCFVIAPIGEEGGPVRIRSDQILNYIIKPVATAVGYSVTRADQIADPGMIDRQILQHIVESDLVVADLTGHNPNVFYELAVRHMLARPTITLIAQKDSLPFDVIQNRTIKIDHNDLDSVDKAKQQLQEAIQATERNPTAQDNPVSFAVELARLSSSENPEDQSTATMMEMHSDLLNGFDRLEQLLQQEDPEDIELFLLTYAQVMQIGLTANKAHSNVSGLITLADDIDSELGDIYGMLGELLAHARSLRSLLRERLPSEIRNQASLKPYHQQRRRLVELARDEYDE